MYQHTERYASGNLHLDPRIIARALGGVVVGRDQVAAPGPSHSRRDRSLSVRLSATAPDGFLVHSHAGDDWRGLRDHVKQALGIPTGRASPKTPTAPRIVFQFKAPDPDKTALRLWDDWAGQEFCGACGRLTECVVGARCDRLSKVR